MEGFRLPGDELFEIPGKEEPTSRSPEMAPQRPEKSRSAPGNGASPRRRPRVGGRFAPAVASQLYAPRKLQKRAPILLKTLRRLQKFSRRQNASKPSFTANRRQLLDSIDVTTLVGLRDRAPTMTCAFAGIGAVVAMRVGDYFPEGKRRWVRLHWEGARLSLTPLPA